MDNNKKENKGIIVLLVTIIIILAVLCVLFATGTISFKSNDVNNNVNNNDEWVDYIKSKNIVVKKSVWNSEKNECEFNSISVSSEDINKIINELATKKITKYYYGSTPPTGTICSDRFKLEYENNKISLEADGYVWVDDNILSNKIDLDVDNTTYADNYTNDSYVYKIDVDFASIFNEKINTNTENTKELKEYIEENYLLCFMEYSNSENLLKENQETNKIYLNQAIQYSTHAQIQHQYEDYIGSYSISLDNIKKFLKEKFNYDYTEEEIKEYFKKDYVEKYDTYMIPVSGGLIPPQIKNIEVKNGEYKINIYIESDHIEEGTVVIKEENNQFYFYSSTGLN